MRKVSLFILLFLLGTVNIFAQKSESSCEENSNKELVCSEEVLAVIKREKEKLPDLPTKKKIKKIEVTEAPKIPPSAPEGKPESDDDGGLDEYSDDDYYGDDYYDEDYYR